MRCSKWASLAVTDTIMKTTTTTTKQKATTTTKRNNNNKMQQRQQKATTTTKSNNNKKQQKQKTSTTTTLSFIFSGFLLYLWTSMVLCVWHLIGKVQTSSKAWKSLPNPVVAHVIITRLPYKIDFLKFCHNYQFSQFHHMHKTVCHAYVHNYANWTILKFVQCLTLLTLQQLKDRRSWTQEIRVTIELNSVTYHHTLILSLDYTTIPNLLPLLNHWSCTISPFI